MQKAVFPKIDITFSPTWWNQYYGMDFGEEKAWQDPLLVTERDRDQRRLLCERFGDVGLGEADPKPNPWVGFEYGHRFMSAFWGCEVAYFKDQWPHAVVLPQARQRMEKLEVPEAQASQAMKLILKNAEVLRERYGQCTANIPFGGPLNNAVSVLGEAIFMACAAEPELAVRTFYKMGEAILNVNDLVEQYINGVNATKTRERAWDIGNCPVGQISPGMYRDVVLPVDLWLRRQFTGEFSLHHCGLFHPYTKVYQPLCPAALDLGPGTDLRITRAAYPDARISAYIEVSSLIGISRDNLDALVRQMIEDSGPINLFSFIRVAEAGPEISDEIVRNLLTASERVKIRA